MRAAVGRIIPFLIAVVATPSEDHLVIGFGQIPPLHYPNEQNQATGFVVDVIREAARRDLITVEWKRVAGSNGVEAALSEGRIDVFPAGIVTKARQARFQISTPWWSEDLSLLARADIGDSPNATWRGIRVVLASPAYLPLASRIAQDAHFDVPGPGELRNGPEATALRICMGQADAALMSHTEVDQVLSRRLAPCTSMSFQVRETNEILPLAIISRWQTSGLSGRLRNRIDDMARDGTLATIAARYPRIPSRSALSLAETLRRRYQYRTFWIVLSAAFAGVAITIGMLIRQVRIGRTLRRLIVEQEQTDRMLRARTEELTVSNEELQAFAYSVSHDLQEPLRMISLYTQMIERRCPPDSPVGRFYLSTILGGTARMQEMMDRLLLLSRIGRSEVPRVAVNIEQLLATVLSDLSPAIRAASAEVNIGPMPTIDGWPDRLSVIFQNLIANALKYRRDDVAPRIEIAAVQQDRKWAFTVRDNGIGFEQQYAEQIFGVFKRLHVQDKYGGTGVGLAIAKRAVERHGGSIWAEGRPNEGCVFYFTLPAQTSTDPAELPDNDVQHQRVRPDNLRT